MVKGRGRSGRRDEGKSQDEELDQTNWSSIRQSEPRKRSRSNRNAESHKKTTRKSESHRSKGRTRTKKLEKVEDQPWFHGSLPREEIKQYLTDDGNFLVRVTEKEQGGFDLVISVRHDGAIFHCILKRDREGWRLDGQAFDSVPELIHHYWKNEIPLTRKSRVRLKTPVRKCPWMLDARQIHEDKKLGSGQFGEVFSGKMRLPEDSKTWIRIAIKKCTNARVMTDAEKSELLKEAKLMLDYNHENVIKIYGVAANRPPMMIVMELCQEGALNKFLRNNKGNTSITEKTRFCLEAAKGMEYLAEKRCVHRDLAARNCLLTKNRVLKIADFGMSRKGMYTMIRKEGRKVPLRWTAPEALKNGGTFTTSSDVYSFGILCWEIYADGEQPWPQIRHKKEVFHRVCSGEQQLPPPTTPPSMRNAMTSCWAYYSSERPSFAQLVKDIEKAMLLLSECPAQMDL